MSTAEPSPAHAGDGPHYAPREHAPGAVASLVFGILGFTVLPLLGSILALVFGYQSRRATRADPQRYTDSLGQAGRILGWVGLALALLVGFVLTWFFFAFFPFGRFF
jgi:hypothetical protein